MKPFLAAALLCAVAPAVAHATMHVVTTRGYWSAVYLAPDNQNNFRGCTIMSSFPQGGMFVEIGVTDQQYDGWPDLRVIAGKTSWNIPQTAHPSMTLQIDNYSLWQKPHNTFVPPPLPGKAGNGLQMSIAPSAYAEFIHQITAGHTLTISFSGNEPPWRFALNGVSAVWDTFMDCASRVNPRFTQAVIEQQNGRGYGYGYGYPPQPYGPSDETQPYGPADSGNGNGPAPYNYGQPRSQPYGPSEGSGEQPAPPPAPREQPPIRGTPIVQDEVGNA